MDPWTVQVSVVSQISIWLVWSVSTIYSLGARGSVVGWGTATNQKVMGSIPDEIIFQLTLTFQLHYGPGVNSASNRNEYQESS
jgi:hypothetical protein